MPKTPFDREPTKPNPVLEETIEASKALDPKPQLTANETMKALTSTSERLEKARDIILAVAIEKRHARGCKPGNSYSWDPIRSPCDCYVVPAMIFVGAVRKETHPDA